MEKIKVEAIYPREVAYKDKKTGQDRTFTAYTVKSDDKFYSLYGFKNSAEIQEGDELVGSVEEYSYTSKDGEEKTGYKLHALTQTDILTTRIADLEKRVANLEQNTVNEAVDKQNQEEDEDLDEIPF